METIEEFENIRILNDEPEFCSCDKNRVSADFFILCEQCYDSSFNNEVYNYKICGMSLLNWVVRACNSQPKIIKIEENGDVLSAIRPYLSDTAEYSVVLFANTPLINRTHINDLLGFVDRKRMNVCKLKKGYVFKNSFIRENSEFYSIDEYDFSSKDFYEVLSANDLGYVKSILSEKVMDFHRNNGVIFENESYVSIDANVEIGKCAEIENGSSICSCSKIGKNSKVGKNVVVSNSNIGDNVEIGIGSVIVDSIIKDGAIIGEGVFIKNSVIGNNCNIGFSSKVNYSSVRNSTNINNDVVIDNSRIAENCKIGKYSKILGISSKSILGENCEIAVNSLIEDSTLKNGTKTFIDEIIKNKAGL